MSLAGPSTRVAVFQNAPKENDAAVLTLNEVLDDRWRQHLHLSGGVWLIPWFEQLRSTSTAVTGNAAARPGLENSGVSEGLDELDDLGRAVLLAFSERLGSAPGTYEWEVR